MFLSLHYCKRLLVAVSVLRRVASAAAAVEFGSRSSSSSSDSRVGKQIFFVAQEVWPAFGLAHTPARSTALSH